MSQPIWEFTAHRASDARAPEHDKYRRLRLTRNPFPSVGVAAENPGYPPFSTIDSDLRSFIQSFIDTGESRMGVVVGEYGTGKTHALRLVQEALQRPGLGFRAKIIYLASAGYEAYSLLRGMLDQFGRDEITKIIWRLLLDDIAAQVKRGGHRWVVTNFVDQIGRGAARANPNLSLPAFGAQEEQHIPTGLQPEDFSDYRTFLATFVRRKLSLGRLRTYAIDFLTHTLDCSALLAAELYDATDIDALRAQAAWDRLTVTGERGAPYKAEREPDLMALVLNLTKFADAYDGLVLLVDEFESTVAATIPRKQSETYLRSLRLIFDRTATQFPYLALLTVTPDAWEVAVQTYPALPQRITKLFRLPAVSPDLAREIIANYLQGARAQEDGAAVDQLYPFTSVAVEVIVGLLPLKTTRALLLFCQSLLAHLADAADVPLPVDEAELPRLAARAGLLEGETKQTGSGF